MSGKASTSALSAVSATTWDLYTMGIVAFGVVGVGLIGYSLLSGNSKAPPAQRTIQSAPIVAAAPAPARFEPAPEVVAASKPVDAKTQAAPSAAEETQKNAAFDRFYVPPAGCSSPPKAKESPDCGVGYGHARMEFERRWALGLTR